MLYSMERLKKEGRGVLTCDDCGKPAPYYKEKKEEKGVEPLYKWQGKWFCVKCFEAIVRVNPHIVYPAETVELQEEINRCQGRIRMLQERIVELEKESSTTPP